MVTFTEGPHAASFILSEANSQRSRDNVTIPVGQKFPPGTVLVTATGAAYVSGAGPLAIAIYGVDTTEETGSGAETRIACITRDAEVNRHCIAWPAGSDDTDIDAAATELATQHIIVRGAPLPSPLPSP